MYFTIDMLAEHIHLSIPTIRRRLAESRAGKSVFPLPISDKWADGCRRKAVWDSRQFDDAATVQKVTAGRKVVDEAAEKAADDWLAARRNKR